MRIIVLIYFVILCNPTFAQFQIAHGPELENDKYNKMNRLLGGDDSGFYAYRIRSKGRGTSFIVEKYDKGTLTPVFSKEINLEGENQTKIEDVLYAQGNVFIFRKQYDNKTSQMALFYQTVSSTGEISEQLKEVISVKAWSYDYVDFNVSSNPDHSKFIIKATYKVGKSYKTDFILMNAASQKKEWTKSVDQNLNSNGMFAYGSGSSLSLNYGYIGLYLDNRDNIYYCVTDFIKTPPDLEKKYKLKVFTINAADQAYKQLDLAFDDAYYVGDIEFSKANDSVLVIGGFLKDVIERKGKDLVKCGIFSFKVNVSNNSLTDKAVNFFSDELLTALESSPKHSKYFKYKLDYIIPIGEDVYYVGQQYKEEYHINTNTYGFGGIAGSLIALGTSNCYYEYEYMDVIVAKYNKNGVFEWIKNSPLRIEARVDGIPHVFNQYFVTLTKDNIHILNNEHPKNFELYNSPGFQSKDLKLMDAIHGSNFVCNTMSLTDGRIIKRSIVMVNEDYCFAPIQERNPLFMPPQNAEIIVRGKGNEIFLYTEDRGKDRFSKMKFE